MTSYLLYTKLLVHFFDTKRFFVTIFNNQIEKQINLSILFS